MSQNTFSLEQILESVNEMRTEVSEFLGNTEEPIANVSADTWQASENDWFEDCEFDPR